MSATRPPATRPPATRPDSADSRPDSRVLTPRLAEGEDPTPASRGVGPRESGRGEALLRRVGQVVWEALSSQPAWFWCYGGFAAPVWWIDPELRSTTARPWAASRSRSSGGSSASTSPPRARS